MVVKVKIYSIRSKKNKRVCFIGSTIENTLEEELQGKIDYYKAKGKDTKSLSIIGFGECYITLLKEIPYSGQINRSKAVYEMKEHIKDNLGAWLDIIN